MSNLADTYIPFDTGPGATATSARWRSMSRAFEYSGIIPGFANQFNATIASGIVTIQPGAVWIDGFYAETTVNHTMNISGPGAPGTIVLRADPVARTISFVYLAGPNTVAGNRPTQPPNATGIFEIPLWYVNSTTQLTEARQFATATNDYIIPWVPSASNNSNYCARGRTWRNAPWTTLNTVHNFGFDVIEFGAPFWINPYQFQCPYADDYLVTTQVGFISSAANQWIILWLLQNTAAQTNAVCYATTGEWTLAKITDIIPCKAGDLITVQSQTSTPGLNGMVGNTWTYMAVRALSR